MIRQIHYGYFLVIALICSLLLTASAPVWDYAEYKTYDLRSQLGLKMPIGNRQASGRVVMVAIEEQAALKKKPFIFWYPDLGQFLTKAADAGATVIGIDIIPVHPLEKKLAEGFKDVVGAPPVGSLEEIGKQFDNSLVAGMMQASQHTVIIQGVAGSLVPYFYDLMAFMGNVQPASLRVETDQDGIFRREYLHLEEDQEGFVVKLFRAAGRTDEISDSFRINYRLLEQVPVYSFEEIASGKFDTAKLRGKLVILGLKSTYDDIHDTPLGPQAGAMIHAAALETLLTNSAPVALNGVSGYFVLLLLCLASAPLTLLKHPFHSFCWVAGMSLAYFAISVVAFCYGKVMPVFPHILAPMVIFTTNYLYRYMTEERGRRQLYETFSYYVDQQIIDKLVTQDPQSLMNGERCDVCVMFLDIRGFTELSEKISSESLVAMLNLFFGRVSEAVQGNQGFVNKFIGDGMLAFFAIGDGYVDDALRAAREICQVTADLNRSGELVPYIGEREIAIGIGLHAGNVIMGNIGSKRKLDFTVIGPPVNLASRIESLTKQFGRVVLASETVRQAAGSGFSFEPLGRAEIKGIAGGAEIYALQI